MSEGDSCDITAKNSCCCSNPNPEKETTDLKAHWDKAYTNNPHEKLGWFETDLSPTFKLLNISKIAKNARIINIGAGSTVLIDELLKLNYTQLIATDISAVALDILEKRVGNEHVSFITDDLTNPTVLKDMDAVDMWIDRAVLHFFTEEKDQQTYFDLLRSKVSKGGFVLLAEFALDGAKKCSGLDVCRYDTAMLSKKLGKDFELQDSFEYTYTMPSGDLRPYIYTLFQKI
tara:strand:- start:2111 stop:2803 length:693 start_codon:yes stop_codon:yes gene_type:complete